MLELSTFRGLARHIGGVHECKEAQSCIVIHSPKRPLWRNSHTGLPVWGSLLGCGETRPLSFSLARSCSKAAVPNFTTSASTPGLTSAWSSTRPWPIASEKLDKMIKRVHGPQGQKPEQARDRSASARTRWARTLCASSVWWARCTKLYISVGPWP